MWKTSKTFLHLSIAGGGLNKLSLSFILSSKAQNHDIGKVLDRYPKFDFDDNLSRAKFLLAILNLVPIWLGFAEIINLPGYPRWNTCSSTACGVVSWVKMNGAELIRDNIKYPSNIKLFGMLDYCSCA